MYVWSRFLAKNTLQFYYITKPTHIYYIRIRSMYNRNIKTSTANIKFTKPKTQERKKKYITHYMQVIKRRNKKYCGDNI